MLMTPFMVLRQTRQGHIVTLMTGMKTQIKSEQLHHNPSLE